MIVLGEVVSESFSLISLATGQTFTRTSSYISNASSVWNPTFTEIGSGVYRYNVTPAVAGFFEWSGSATNGEIITINFEVEATTSAVVVVPTAASSGTARYLLRRTISRKLGNYVPLTATANSGNATTFVDNLHLRNPDNAFVGRQLYFYSGTVANIALSRFITASTQSTTLVTFPAVTSNIALDDVAEIHNVRGSGWTVEEIHDEIDTVLRWASTSVPNYDREDIATAFDQDAPTLTIPSSFTGIYRVDWLDGDGLYHEIPAASEATDPGWWLNRGEREIIINGVFRTYADTYTVRMYGRKEYAALSTDASVTPCNEEWLVLQVCANLMASGAERVSDGTRSQWALQYQKQADQRRDLLVGPPPPNLVLV